MNWKALIKAVGITSLGAFAALGFLSIIALLSLVFPPFINIFLPVLGVIGFGVIVWALYEDLK